MDNLDVSILLGKTLESIYNKDNRNLLFTTSDGEQYELYHKQNCCEEVIIESIVGDLNDLLGEPLLESEVVSNHTDDGDYNGDHGVSVTWTFYKFGTRKGHVTIRWLGASNGYYSEEVQLDRIK